MARTPITQARASVTVDRSVRSEQPLVLRNSGSVRYDSSGFPAVPSRVATNGLLSNVNKLCINFWVKRATNRVDNHIMTGGTNPNFNEGAWEIYFNSALSDRIEVRMHDWSGSTTAQEFALTSVRMLEGWNFVTVVMDRTIEAKSGAGRIFVNGVEDTITSGSGTAGAFSSGFNGVVGFGAGSSSVSQRSDVHIGMTQFYEFTGTFDATLPAKMRVNPYDAGSMTLISEWTFFDPASSTVAENSVNTDYNLNLGSDGVFGEDLFTTRPVIT